MGIISTILGKKKNETPPICDVDLERYLGTWYEIARYPNRFEEGLDNATANYTLRSDGRIQVINSGLKNGKREEAKAVATVPDKTCTGKLLVSFFWPFKGEYRVVRIGKDYDYAVVTGSTMDYLWILSRQPVISKDLHDDLCAFVSSKGYDLEKIIWVKQEKNES
ncbi:MAG: lipocalin family protein [Methanomicrobiales archaeon]